MKEKSWTDEQLVRKVQRMRSVMAFLAPRALKKQKNHIGKEMFLDTDEGRVRTLAYNLDKPEKLPLFINIHGSGFTMGNAEMDDPFMMGVAEGANVKIISIDYSLAPEAPFPKALNECYAVVKYAAGHGEGLGIDAGRIAVGGHSAGGNFTAAICLMDNDRKQLDIKCLVMDYPPLDVYTDAGEKPQPFGSLPVSMCRMFDACYLNDKEGRKNPLISPVFATVDQVRSFPPTLVITASGDSLCGEGERFKDKLVEAGVEVAFERFKGPHGFNLRRGAESDRSWQMIIDHLKHYLWN